MAGPPPFSSPAEKLAGQAMLAGIRARLDSYALDIFDLWYGGKAKPEEIFDSPRWAAYMQADKGLERQIDAHMVRFGMMKVDEYARFHPQKLLASFPEEMFETSFHAEVGGSAGGYASGYNLLHGSNRDVGDFQIAGRMRIDPGQDGGYVLTTVQHVLTFNDKVDVNFRYASDATFANLTRNLARAAGTPQPRDFILRIRWRDPSRWQYDIPAPSRTGAPAWLKSYPGRN